MNSIFLRNDPEAELLRKNRRWTFREKVGEEGDCAVKKERSPLLLPRTCLLIKALLFNFTATIQAMPLQQFIAGNQAMQLFYRLKIKGEPIKDAWSRWLIQPSENYLETENDGPYAIKDIEWIDIDPVEIIKAGKLVPAKRVIHTTVISKLLKEHQVDFSIVEKWVRIVP